MQPFQPQNTNLRTLFTKVYDKEFAKNKELTPDMIKDYIIDSVQNVYKDKDAINEARQNNWLPLNCIIEHYEQHKKYFVNMSFDTSVCFDIWMYIYH